MLDIFTYTPTLENPARNNIKRMCATLAITLMDNVPDGVNLRNALQSLQQLKAEALNALPELKTDDSS